MADRLLPPTTHPGSNLAQPLPTPPQGPNLDCIAIKSSDQSQQDVCQTISRRFPEAKDFLKERLATSIERRRARFLKSQQQDKEARLSSTKSGTSTDLESKHSGKSLETETGSPKSTDTMRWQNQEDLPKSPEIGSSQTHFVCQICFLSTSSKEAKGDSWM
jgi:hypothetical protein